MRLYLFIDSQKSRDHGIFKDTVESPNHTSYQLDKLLACPSEGILILRCFPGVDEAEDDAGRGMIAVIGHHLKGDGVR